MSDRFDEAGRAVVAGQVVVGGLAIAFRRAGQGPPLLLLHGGMGDSRGWLDQLRELADEFAVVAWDAPGCGASSDPPETFRLPDYADCLAVFVEAMDLGRPHVLGHSFGAGLALELYGRAFAEADLRDVLPAIKVPTLLLCGEVDQRSPLVVGQVLHAAIPTSTLVVLPGVGHECYFEAPERFNAEVRSFLRSVG